MITKEQLAASMTRECDIAQHLFTKLTPASFDYQPSPAQRTTRDLLRYLAICGISGIHCLSTGSWKSFGDFTARVNDMPPEEFPAMMARQKAEIEAFFAEVSPDALRDQAAPMPAGGTLPLGLAIVNGPFKWLAAYKLQLFTYAKASGAHDIGTPNAWAGVDRRS